MRSMREASRPSQAGKAKGAGRRGVGRVEQEVAPAGAALEGASGGGESDAPAWSGGPGPADLTSIVGDNLRRLRKRRDLSLERLARLSGVSRAMLGQIELGHSAPTINVLWKIASALRVPFATLLRQQGSSGPRVVSGARARVLSSRDGSFRSRALFPADAPRAVEFYELTLAPRSSEAADAHAPGTTENLTVARGAIDMVVGGERHRLEEGDAILFEADVPHVYDNSGDVEAVMYLVMTYAERDE